LKSFSSDSKLIIPKIIENLSKEVKELREKESMDSPIKEEHQELSKKVAILENEQELLIENINEKNREIHDLNNNANEFESQIEKLKNSLDDISKNYETLLRNHKSAEKLNEFQKKIQHLIEEKSTLTNSHGLIVDSLTNEIKSLTEKLNEYQKNDKSLKLEIDYETKFKKEEKKETLSQDIKGNIIIFIF
jgi:chromosome segregation ATPase